MEKNKEKPTPSFLKSNYPYKTAGDAVTDLDSIESKVIYEIKCNECELSIRSQGQNVHYVYKRLINSGCIGCGNKELLIKRINMCSKNPNDIII